MLLSLHRQLKIETKVLYLTKSAAKVTDFLFKFHFVATKNCEMLKLAAMPSCLEGEEQEINVA